MSKSYSRSSLRSPRPLSFLLQLTKLNIQLHDAEDDSLAAVRLVTSEALDRGLVAPGTRRQVLTSIRSTRPAAPRPTLMCLFDVTCLSLGVAPRWSFGARL